MQKRYRKELDITGIVRDACLQKLTSGFPVLRPRIVGKAGLWTDGWLSV